MPKLSTSRFKDAQGATLRDLFPSTTWVLMLSMQPWDLPRRFGGPSLFRDRRLSRALNSDVSFGQDAYMWNGTSQMVKSPSLYLHGPSLGSLTSEILVVKSLIEIGLPVNRTAIIPSYAFQRSKTIVGHQHRRVPRSWTIEHVTIAYSFRFPNTRRNNSEAHPLVAVTRALAPDIKRRSLRNRGFSFPIITRENGREAPIRVRQARFVEAGAVLEVTSSPPPAFGKELLKHFAMDPDYVNLNNGSYGTPPRAVLQSAFDISLEVESNPEAFHRYGYKGRLDQARGELAELIGAHKDEVFLVNNASTGVGTVMRNFVWEEGDVIITFSTSYAAIANQAQYISDVPPHPRVVSFPLVFPKKHSDIISSFTEFISSPSAQAKGPNNKRVVVIDSIVSNPGALLPWKELVKIAKEKGIWTVVDAAHSIGQEVGLNLGEAGPDFWTSNCHKWLYAKRSCAVLYIPFR
ncbi:hypothetical protein NMY22_g16810 [Coprinellus aureogranulatus]|nr:hypothetical protein NMY22_g16810 [Coprinellus aureogranulatus]